MFHVIDQITREPKVSFETFEEAAKKIDSDFCYMYELCDIIDDSGRRCAEEYYKHLKARWNNVIDGLWMCSYYLCQKKAFVEDLFAYIKEAQRLEYTLSFLREGNSFNFLKIDSYYIPFEKLSAFKEYFHELDAYKKLYTNSVVIKEVERKINSLLPEKIIVELKENGGIKTNVMNIGDVVEMIWERTSNGSIIGKPTKMSFYGAIFLIIDFNGKISNSHLSGGGEFRILSLSKTYDPEKGVGTWCGLAEPVSIY